MATWVIGDVQGCFGALSRLLRAIDFQPGRDQVWLAGDLVNRGPDSLGVLRWAAGHASSVRVVLGNHDLHLLARAAGTASAKRRDTLDPVLVAPDRKRLLDWLSAQPLILPAEVGGASLLLLHAGMLPGWTAEEALGWAAACEALLQSGERDAFLGVVAGTVAPADAGQAELARFVAAVTRVRCVDDAGEPFADFSGVPEEAPAGAVPWFDAPDRASASTLVVAGHWAAAGLRVLPSVILTDSGCVWGQQLSAVRLEDRHVVQVAAGLGAP